MVEEKKIYIAEEYKKIISDESLEIIKQICQTVSEPGFAEYYKAFGLDAYDDNISNKFMNDFIPVLAREDSPDGCEYTIIGFRLSTKIIYILEISESMTRERTHVRKLCKTSLHDINKSIKIIDESRFLGDDYDDDEEDDEDKLYEEKKKYWNKCNKKYSLENVLGGIKEHIDEMYWLNS